MAASTRSLASSLRTLSLGTTTCSTSAAAAKAVRFASTSRITLRLLRLRRTTTTMAHTHDRVSPLYPPLHLYQHEPNPLHQHTTRSTRLHRHVAGTRGTHTSNQTPTRTVPLLPPNSSPPSLASARQSLWVNVDALQQILGTNLKAAQYRQIVSRLGLLARYATLVSTFESSKGRASWWGNSMRRWKSL